MKLYLKDIEKYAVKSNEKYKIDYLNGWGYRNNEFYFITTTPKDWYLAGEYAAVYFLVKENEVVYIGKTTCANRIEGHKNKDYDYVYFIPTTKSVYSKLELNLIRKYSTKYNKTHNYATLQKL